MAYQSRFMFGSILVFLSTQQVVAIPSTNTTSTEDIIACSYPVSGQYGAAPRYLFYLSLYIAIWLRHHEWLVAGALASAMLFSSTAIIHAATIVFQGLSPQVFDLDLLGILALLLPAMCLSGVVLDWSALLSNSRARPLVKSWGIFIWIGLIICLLGTANILDKPNSKDHHQTGVGDGSMIPTRNSELKCLANSTAGELLQSADQLLYFNFNCTYDCFSFRSAVRGADEILAIPQTILHGPLLTGAAWMISVFVAIFAAIVLLVDICASRKVPRALWDLGCSSLEQLTGLTFGLPTIFLGIVSIPSIVVMEIILWSVPRGEEPYAIGQWGPVVTAVFALGASVVDHYFLKPEGGDGTKGNRGIALSSQPPLESRRYRSRSITSTKGGRHGSRWAGN